MTRTGTSRLRLVATGVAVATAVAGGVGASAHVAAEPTSQVPYRIQIAADSVQLTVAKGSVAVEDGQLVIRTSSGEPAMIRPLHFFLGDRAFPITATTAGRTATLTPVTDVAKSTKADEGEVATAKAKAKRYHWVIDGPQTRQQRDDEALKKFVKTTGDGRLIGMVVGIAIGAVLGGFVGCVLAGIISIGIGCPAGFMMGVSLGSFAGSLLVGGGSVIHAGIEYFDTINSPFKPKFKFKRIPHKRPAKTARPS